MDVASWGNVFATKASPEKTAVRGSVPTTVSAADAAWRDSVFARRVSRAWIAPFPPVLKTAITVDAASMGNVCATKDSLETPVEKEAVRMTAMVRGNVWTAAACVMKATLARIAQKVIVVIYILYYI